MSTKQETAETMRLRADAFRSLSKHLHAWSHASTSDPVVQEAIEAWRTDAAKLAATWDERASEAKS